MIHIIPSVKLMQETECFIEKKGLSYDKTIADERLVSALSKLPYDEQGIKVDISIMGGTEEAYQLWISEEAVRIEAQKPEGVFNAIQTLRQIWEHEEIPCLYIKDAPDFEYRGFYHDVTRGKVPTVETIKKLIDEMAYYKLNSLQLYVEHTFEFEECKDLIEKTGYLTKEELKEIGEYCRQNFIEFIPSIATFGHMYEILQQDKYKHLRVLKDYKEAPNFWDERMGHHTIDPLNPESIELVKSLIHQYGELFESDTFNICCDETFDLRKYGAEGYDVGKLYVDFVKQIIDYVKQKDKKVMMWADILLQHPEVINELPEDTVFLNWDYSANPSEKNIEQFAKLQRKQIVCPGTSTWSRLCENLAVEEKNISLMAEYGYKHGAIGVLNTNWGDWGNPASIELAMYGLVLGAEKSWSANAIIDEKFYDKVNFLTYGSSNGMQSLKKLNEIHGKVCWYQFCWNYFNQSVNSSDYMTKEVIEMVQKDYQEYVNELSGQTWKKDECRQEMLLSAEGLCVMAEIASDIAGRGVDRITDTEEWLKKYRKSWIDRNKESELCKIEDMFRRTK